jgi:hypothetical protein
MSRTFLPFPEHALSDFGKSRMLHDVGTDLGDGLGPCFVDALLNLSDLGRGTGHPGFAQPAKLLRIRPFRRAV